jgi:regulator of replication initiation timing
MGRLNADYFSEGNIGRDYFCSYNGFKEFIMDKLEEYRELRGSRFFEEALQELSDRGICQCNSCLKTLIQKKESEARAESSSMFSDLPYHNCTCSVCREWRANKKVHLVNLAAEKANKEANKNNARTIPSSEVELTRLRVEISELKEQIKSLYKKTSNIFKHLSNQIVINSEFRDGIKDLKRRMDQEASIDLSTLLQDIESDEEQQLLMEVEHMQSIMRDEESRQVPVKNPHFKKGFGSNDCEFGEVDDGGD